MYRTRGRPEDPWNVAAVEQNKGLAAAIQVNQIQRNGLVPNPTSEIPNRIQRQEFLRRRNNYQEFREKYHDKIKLSGAGQEYPKYNKRSYEQTYKHEVQILNKFVAPKVNGRCSNSVVKARYQPAIVRAPLRPVKTINVEVPGKYQEGAIFCPPKFGEGEAVSFYQKLKEFEKLKDRVQNIVGTDQDPQSGLERELQEASIELDIGNAQLEEIKKILEAKRCQKLSATEERLLRGNRTQFNNSLGLYNVQVPERSQVNRITSTEKDERINNKTKFLLTLNDVHERIQKLQTKFFKSSRPPYKSVSNAWNPNKHRASVQVLYKNDNYTEIKPTDASSTNQMDQSLCLDFSSLDQTNMDIPRPRSTGQQYRAAENHVVPDLSEDFLEQEMLDCIRPRTAERHKLPNECTQQKITNKSLLNKQACRNKKVAELKKKIQAEIVNKSRLSEIAEANEIGDHAEMANDFNYYDSINTDPTAYEDNNVIKDQTPQDLHTLRKVIAEGCNGNSDRKISFAEQLQESIFKSNYLMKEFDIDQNEMPFKLNELPPIPPNKHLSKNARPYATPLQKLRKEKVQWDYNQMKNPQLFDPVHTMLKDTLFCVDEV